jgi:hypothetical protein
MHAKKYFILYEKTNNTIFSFEILGCMHKKNLYIILLLLIFLQKKTGILIPDLYCYGASNWISQLRPNMKCNGPVPTRNKI